MSAAPREAEAPLTGVFAGPTTGLRFSTSSLAGFTGENGEFSYRPGEAVTFFLGKIALGTVMGAQRLNLAQLATRVSGNPAKLADPLLTNLARLLHTLDQDGLVENGVKIAPEVHDIVGASVINFNQAEIDPDLADVLTAQRGNFAKDPNVLGLLEKLNNTPGVFTARTPRTLVAPEAARNEVRRNILGIVKMTDMKIPLRDGSFVYADVFLPAAKGAYPVIMNMGAYGKSFYHECVCNEDDARKKEELEDRYFAGNPDGLPYEVHETVNTVDWVPNGYAVVRIDGRGVCRSPGLQAPFSLQESEDFYDAIEWGGTQPWSNGNVGLWGMSYYAMVQHNAACLQPPHLKAMVAIGTDSDSYNEYIYTGGLMAEGWWNWWWNGFAGRNACGERRTTDWWQLMMSNPFNDPDIYGPRGRAIISPEVEKATAPMWIIGSLSTGVIHQIGSVETFVRSTGVRDKKLDLIEDWFYYSYTGECVAEHMRFFDHWLKGDQNGIMDDPRIRVDVRTGNGGYYRRYEDAFPVAGTTYQRMYLDATASEWQGDGLRRDFLRLAPNPPVAESTARYAAEVDPGKQVLLPLGWVGGTPRWSTGVSFISDPLPEAILLAGYMKLGLWVSSTSSDMDVHAVLRVYDEHDREINYARMNLNEPGVPFPVGYGLLKVSHRKFDAARTTDFWPVHTHTEADYAPLDANEIVAIEVGLMPSTALIKKGHRLRLDVQPFPGPGVTGRTYDPSYHTGAENVIYTGPDHPCYVQLPIIPHN